MIGLTVKYNDFSSSYVGINDRELRSYIHRICFIIKFNDTYLTLKTICLALP